MKQPLNNLAILFGRTCLQYLSMPPDKSQGFLLILLHQSGILNNVGKHNCCQSCRNRPLHNDDKRWERIAF